MKKCKKNFFLVILIFLQSNSVIANEEVDYCNLIRNIVSKYNEELKMRKHLFLEGFGGVMIDDIEQISLSYRAPISPNNIDEARNFYVEIMEEYIKRINSSTQVRPFLHNYPFDFYNVDMEIKFLNFNGKLPEKGALVHLFIKEEQLCYGYIKDDPVNSNFKPELMYSEPYIQAVKKANK